MSPLQQRQRRFVVPTVLLVVALAFGWLAKGAGSGTEAASAGSAPAPLTTPVLSVRRVAPYLVAPIADARLRERLDRIVAESPDDSCLMVTLGGRVLFEHNPDLPLTPASTEKLVTATAALTGLDPDGTFRTRVVAAVAPADGRVDGDLFLVGGGDPILSTKAYTDHFSDQPQIATSLEALADAVVAAGVREVTGRVVGDEALYDTDRYPDTWPERYAEQSQVGPLSALSVNDAFDAWPERQEREGTVENTPTADPPTYAADQLRILLGERGVRVSGGAAAGPAPAGATEVAAVESPPLRRVVQQLLTESDNQTAELLVKELGRVRGGAPSTPAGVQVVTALMEQQGLARPGTVAVDGSGLDEGNRASCRLLVNILDRYGPESSMADSLAIAGKTGTLSDRFTDSPAKERVRAKTGSLNTVSALTGFASAVQGPVLTFAYIANGEYVSDDLLDLQEAMAEDLITYPEGPPLGTVGPQA